jgi:uncharacterized protein (TIGR00369 family)
VTAPRRACLPHRAERGRLHADASPTETGGAAAFALVLSASATCVRMLPTGIVARPPAQTQRKDREPAMPDKQTGQEAISKRSRTIEWEDPAPTIRAGSALGGLDYLNAIRLGVLPAVLSMELLGMRIAEVEEGRVVFAADPAEYHYNPMGAVHGGILATLLDSAMGSAVQSLASAGMGYTTLEFKVNFVRPVTEETGTVYAEGRVVHRGNRSAIAEGRLTDAAGTLCAHAVTTCLLLGRPSAGQ